MHDRNRAEREEATRNGHKYCMQSVALSEELLNYNNTKIRRLQTIFSSRRYTSHYDLCGAITAWQRQSSSFDR
jgi:hypothetical protein